MWHGRSSAYMWPCTSVSTVLTSTHRLSPAGTASGWPSTPVQTMAPPSAGFSDQKACTPRSLA